MARNRRHFLQGAGALGGVALLAPGSLVAETPLGDIQTLDQDYYAARLKEWFYLHDPDAVHQGQLRLLRVELDQAEPGMTAFSLQLRSRRYAALLPAGYYQVSGEPFDLYIQHIATHRNKHWYLAHFALLQS